MNQILTIQNDKINITDLSVDNLNAAALDARSIVASSIVVDTLQVNNLITDKDISPNTEWTANTDDDLNGRGLKWIHNDNLTQLIYRSGGRLWNSNSFDIPYDASYMIDNVPIITVSSLGSSIVKSNLQQVGALRSLDVIGDTSISGFAYFNSINNRLGLGTSEPSASISIVDNNVEIAIGSPEYNIAQIGTRSNHNLVLITDDLPRLVVKNNGEVHIGSEQNKSGVLKVFGTLHADVIVSDTRLERSTPLEFNKDIYNNGLLWTSNGPSKQFILRESPERFWSTESIDLDGGKSFYINNINVLSETSLGDSVVNSKLTSLGELSSLSVNGIATVKTIESSQINSSEINVLENLNINNNGINVKTSFAVSVNNLSCLYSDSTEIVLGNKENSSTPIKVFGKLAVGINKPDPTVSFSVNGDVSFNNKKFTSGATLPVTGNFNKGDICWNDEPTATGYVGWVCIKAGNPGIWKPFGLIGA